MRPPKAFTLIELLIVVLIIAILAAIAVPNFLEAQTRAKTSRAKADLRVADLAITSYVVDNAANPAIGIPQPDGSTAPDLIPGLPRIPRRLTTPIKYISSREALIDKFFEAKRFNVGMTLSPAVTEEFKYYIYVDLLANSHDPRNSNFSLLTPVVVKDFGTWMVLSVGPDQVIYRSMPEDESLYGPSYDPTNGSISNGEIYRTQRFAEVSIP